MAIGIDRYLHRKLLACLSEMSEDLMGDPSWGTLREELQQTYDQAIDMLHQAELSAVKYNQLQAIVKSSVSIEQRKRKKKAKENAFDQ